MTLSPQVTFRGLEPDPALEKLIRKELAALERFAPRIMSCHVAIEAPQKAGRAYRVRIDLAVPNRALVVERAPSIQATPVVAATEKRTKAAELRREHRDAARAVRDAFKEMREKLRDETRIARGKVKQHVPASTAVVAKLFPDMDYGFLETHDGRELFFHRNSVLDRHFDHLRIGSEVNFAEEEGDRGPQASTVRLTHLEPALRKAAKVVPLKARAGKTR